jgi:TetR/AcrR family transcriptional repressor of nem operon
MEQPLRKSKLEAAQTRETIVTAAADLNRSTGIAEASPAEMMGAAGLTHGRFCRHFRNKEHLVLEDLSAAGEKAVMTIGWNMAKGGLKAVVDGYLSTYHRDARLPHRGPPPVLLPVCRTARGGRRLHDSAASYGRAVVNSRE